MGVFTVLRLDSNVPNQLNGWQFPGFLTAPTHFSFRKKEVINYSHLKMSVFPDLS